MIWHKQHSMRLSMPANDLQYRHTVFLCPLLVSQPGELRREVFRVSREQPSNGWAWRIRWPDGQPMASMGEYPDKQSACTGPRNQSKDRDSHAEEVPESDDGYTRRTTKVKGVVNELPASPSSPKLCAKTAGLRISLDSRSGLKIRP